jgi:hypothetical protein
MINVVKKAIDGMAGQLNPYSAAMASGAGSLVTGLFNQRSANKQMRFQDQQSRTQYQRAVSDMKRAGLNPMLAAKLGGNSAMSGASATMPDLGAAVSSGFQAAKTAAETRRIQEMTPHEAAKVAAEAYNAELTYEQIEANIEQIVKSTQKIGVDINLGSLKLPEAKAMAAFWEATGDLGKYVKAVEAAKNAGISIGDLVNFRAIGAIKRALGGKNKTDWKGRVR